MDILLFCPFWISAMGRGDSTLFFKDLSASLGHHLPVQHVPIMRDMKTYRQFECRFTRYVSVVAGEIKLNIRGLVKVNSPPVHSFPQQVAMLSRKYKPRLEGGIYRERQMQRIRLVIFYFFFLLSTNLLCGLKLTMDVSY